jgi:RHS repeat-associated protein
MPNQVTFATYEAAGTSMLYAQNRYYDPARGRFTTPDPSGSSGHLQTPLSWNRYAYVLGDPVNNSDPTGLDGCGPGQTWMGEGCYGMTGGGPASGLFFSGVGPAPSASEVYGSAAPVQSGGSSIGTASSDLVAGEANYVFQTVLPGFLGSPPELQSFSWIKGSTDTSINISYASVAKISAWSVTATTGLGPVGALIGSAIGGGGVFPGYAIGSMFGAGATVAWIPTSGTVFLGPALTFTPGLGGGSGFSVSGYYFPSGQDPYQTLSGWSGSVSYQPMPWAGSTAMRSPGQNPVVGPSFGTRVPVTVGGGYGVCVRNCRP